MSNAPDRVWAKPSDAGWLHGVCSDVLCDDYGGEYLLSTPAREHADELVEALEVAGRKLLAYVGVCKGDKELTEAILPAIHSVLAKIKEASNE